MAGPGRSSKKNGRAWPGRPGPAGPSQKNAPNVGVAGTIVPRVSDAMAVINNIKNVQNAAERSRDIQIQTMQAVQNNITY